MTLDHAKVAAAGGEIHEAYQQALKGKPVVKEFLDEPFAPPGKKERYLLVPRVTENFIDQVVALAGGRRILLQELGNIEGPSAPLNADYIIGDLVVELKLLEQEGLKNADRQASLAKILEELPTETGVPVKRLNALPPEFKDKVNRSLGKPIEGALRTAKGQLRETLARIDGANLGGVLIINSGFGSMDHEELIKQIRHACRKFDLDLSAMLAISVKACNSGIDTFVTYEIEDFSSSNPSIQALRKAFEAKFEELMTKMIQGETPQNHPRMTPLHPITFEVDGMQFLWE